MSPKPPIPKVVQVDDPELHESRKKPLKELAVNPPTILLPPHYQDPPISESFLPTLDPPQSPEAYCEDLVNFPQHFKDMTEIHVLDVKYVDLLR